MLDVTFDEISIDELQEPEWGTLIKKEPISFFQWIKSYIKPEEVYRYFIIENSDGERRRCRALSRRYSGTKVGGRVMLGKEFYNIFS